MRRVIFGIIHVHRRGENELLLVAGTSCLNGFFLGLGERGQKHAGQDRDDRDDNEQFDQCEGAAALDSEIQIHAGSLTRINADSKGAPPKNQTPSDCTPFPARPAKLLRGGDQPLIFGMGSYPKPNETVRPIFGQGAVVQRNPNGP